MMAVAILSASPSDPHSPPETREVIATPSIDKPAPIDPFSINIKSWEEWSSKLLPPPLPRSIDLPTPPKIDLFSNKPLPFAPHRGPITLDNKPSDVQSIGPINLFESKSIEKSPEPVTMVEETISDERIEGGIVAPAINDTEEFSFEWPSEDIKKACEDLFPGDKECDLPVLNWIAPEQKTNERGEEMQDIRHH